MALESNSDKDSKKPEGVEASKDGDKEKIIQVTESQLRDIVEDQISKSDKSNTNSNIDIGELVRAISGEKGGHVYAQQPISSEYIDMDDFMESPATFFSYKFIYTIYDDYMYGAAIKTPYGRPIKFRPIYRYKKKGLSVRDVKIVTVSMAKVHSKKEIFWLEKHSKFNVSFFKTTKDAERIDDMFADKLAEASTLVNGMHQANIIKRAQAEGMQISDDLEDVKRRLIMHLADKRMKDKRQYVKPLSSDFNPETDLDQVIDEKVTKGETTAATRY